MTQLRFQIQCVSVLLAGMLLSNAACSPGASESDVNSERDAAAFKLASDIQAEETANWVLSKVFWPRCQDRNFLNRRTLSEAENKTCDASQSESDFVTRFKQDHPATVKFVGWALATLGGGAAFALAGQTLALEGGAAVGLGGSAATGTALTVGGLPLSVALTISLAAIVIGLFLIDFATLAAPLVSEMVQILVQFYQEREATTSQLLRLYALETELVDQFGRTLGPLFAAAGMAVIPFVAGLMSLTQRAVTAYNTAPLQLSHTMPVTVTEAQTRVYTYLAQNNIVRYSPVAVERAAVFQSLLASTSTPNDVAPVFRANIENVFAALAAYGVSVSRSLQSATIHLVEGLGAQAGYEGVYEITLPTTCQASGCSVSPVTIWIPAANALVTAQSRPVVLANVLLATDDGADEVTVTGGTAAGAEATNDEATVETAATGAADIAAGLRDIAEALRQGAERQAQAAESAGNAVADAIYEQARQLSRIADELGTSNRPPPKNLCNQVGTVLATATPFVVGAIAYGRLNAEECSTCKDRLDTAMVGAGTVAFTTLVLKRRLFNLFQSGGAKTIGRIANRIANKTFACAANPFDGYDLAVSAITAGTSVFAIGALWSFLTSADRVGNDWANSLCEGPLECVNPDEDFVVPGAEAEEGAAGPARLDYTECAGTDERCEDRCVATCREQLVELGEGFGAACDRLCAEFEDAAAGTKNPLSVCTNSETIDAVCSGLNTPEAWLDQFQNQGWVSCAGGGILAPSVEECP